VRTGGMIHHRRRKAAAGGGGAFTACLLGRSWRSRTPIKVRLAIAPIIFVSFLCVDLAFAELPDDSPAQILNQAVEEIEYLLITRSYKGAISRCNEFLLKQPGGPTIIQQRVRANLNTDRFKDALTNVNLILQQKEVIK
jgi:hypothetical protein